MPYSDRLSPLKTVATKNYINDQQEPMEKKKRKRGIYKMSVAQEEKIRQQTEKLNAALGKQAKHDDLWAESEYERIDDVREVRDNREMRYNEG